MTDPLYPQCRPMLIGSQPLKDHDAAMHLVLTHVPEIPNWVQLPVYPQEGMVAQFVGGMPGLTQREGRAFVDTAAPTFNDQLVAFFEAYLAQTDLGGEVEKSRFGLTPECARGFFTLIKALAVPSDGRFAVKGQITGPITFCTSLTDQDRRAVFYDDTVRDAGVKLLALKAAWQARRLDRFGLPVIIFVDEPALAGFGSSEMISISREDIAACLQEVATAIHGQGALVGVHVCANTDWSLLLDGGVDIVNFDAHGYFDKFLLYVDQIKSFLQSGGCLAWGMVPTLQPDQVAAETVESLWERWQSYLQQMTRLGLDEAQIKRQSFITPSCGTGSLPPELSERVLVLTEALSRKIRQA
ncbi:MAG: hypothetical protein HKP58_04720 [Desulfatitalea sp.]|nr:hypothetical protein [Desulfatitalea sp.]NNJ99695.1 hypothetical protein [Desulfatitalea sp.]